MKLLGMFEFTFYVYDDIVQTYPYLVSSRPIKILIQASKLMSPKVNYNEVLLGLLLN